MGKIERLSRVTNRNLADINALLQELSPDAIPLTMPELRSLLRDARAIWLVIREGETIIGTGRVICIRTATGTRARVEDVVVSARHRGKGWGKKLMVSLIKEARKRHVSSVDLTSHHGRKDAHNFYKRLGFEIRDTSVYRLILKKSHKQ